MAKKLTKKDHFCPYKHIRLSVLASQIEIADETPELEIEEPTNEQE